MTKPYIGNLSVEQRAILLTAEIAKLMKSLTATIVEYSVPFIPEERRSEFIVGFAPALDKGVKSQQSVLVTIQECLDDMQNRVNK